MSERTPRIEGDVRGLRPSVRRPQPPVPVRYRVALLLLALAALFAVSKINDEPGRGEPVPVPGRTPQLSEEQVEGEVNAELGESGFFSTEETCRELHSPLTPREELLCD